MLISARNCIYDYINITHIICITLGNVKLHVLHNIFSEMWCHIENDNKSKIYHLLIIECMIIICRINIHSGNNVGNNNCININIIIYITIYINIDDCNNINKHNCICKRFTINNGIMINNTDYNNNSNRKILINDNKINTTNTIIM